MSFRLKTVLGIALIEAGLLFLLVVSGLGYLRSSNQEALAAKSSTTASLFATTIKQAMIATDLASLDDFMNEVAKYPGLLYAVVTDGSGRRLASRGAPGGALVMAKAEIVEGGIQFGTVEIGFDQQGVEQTVGQAKSR